SHNFHICKLSAKKNAKKAKTTIKCGVKPSTPLRNLVTTECLSVPLRQQNTPAPRQTPADTPLPTPCADMRNNRRF
ncbi:MAG: hypothetical protein J6R73_02510, partial [Alistipes sp.]|nr:hypothetical protein [Alistipes sp.]